MLMTPDPTTVPRRVRDRMIEPIQYHRQEEFTEFYLGVTDKLERLFDTGNDAIVMGGEGILGLEAAVASTVDDGETVLCVANGYFGGSFAEFVEMAGGEPVVVSAPFDQSVDVEAVKRAVAEREVDVATAVHCETPTGILNDLDEVLAVLQDAGVLTVVDIVTSLGGTPTPTEHCDVALCGSQKVLSSPPGLSLVSVSDRAWRKVEETEDSQFYASLQPWKDSWVEEQYLPYSHLVSNLYALDESLDMLFEEGLARVHERHEEVAQVCRDRGDECGLDIYASMESLSSPTVTAFEVDGTAFDIKRRVAEDHGIVLATGEGLANEEDVLLVGHMGHHARLNRVERTMDAIETVVQGP